MKLFTCNPHSTQHSLTTTATHYKDKCSNDDSSCEDLKSPTATITTTRTTTTTLKNGLSTTSDSVMGFDLCKTILPLANYKMYPTEITVCSFDVDLLSWEMIDDTNTVEAKQNMVIDMIAVIKDELTRKFGTNNVAVLRGGEQKGHNDNNNDRTHNTKYEDSGVTIVESDSDTYISGLLSMPEDISYPRQHSRLYSAARPAPRTILPILTTVVASKTSSICSFPSCKNVEDKDCHCAFCTCYNTEDTDPCQCAVCTIQ